jgi:hypothetical protein
MATERVAAAFCSRSLRRASAAFICDESTHASAKGFCRESLQASIVALMICLLRSCVLLRSVVNSGAFLKNFPCNHIITIKKKFSFSGEVKDSVIFPFYFLLHKLHKPTPLPCATP